EYWPRIGLYAELRAWHRTTALQPVGHAFLRNVLGLRRHARAAEVFLSQNIDGDLRPGAGHHHVFHLEDDGSIRIGNARGARDKVEAGERVLSRDGIAPRDLHMPSLPLGGSNRLGGRALV